MVRISEDLIRRRAEHNNCEIFSLEEISLHQQDIERIECVDRWCRDLKILYLQNNLISKIENVGRLKKLEYLNLALNNIEVIENLEGCEELQKLDLTVNFVGRLSSVESLKQNVHLRELFLVGNPCAEFKGYRPYVLACLPQLQWLDGTAIGRAERIRALQNFEDLKECVLEQEADYVEKRNKQKREGLRKTSRTNTNDLDHHLLSSCSEITEENGNQEPNRESHPNQNSNSDDEEADFWEKPCAFTPESRLEAHRHLEEKRRTKERTREPNKEDKPLRTLITSDGRVLNVNEPKLDFTISEDEEINCVLLDLHVYRHCDTSLLEVDVQPTYIRVTVKGKVFQLVLPAEVEPDSSIAQRSQTTGHLLISMPKVHGDVKLKTSQKLTSGSCRKNESLETSKEDGRTISGCQRLDVDPSKSFAAQLANIVSKEKRTSHGPLKPSWPCQTQAKPVSKDFVDDPEVPPLM